MVWFCFVVWPFRVLFCCLLVEPNHVHGTGLRSCIEHQHVHRASCLCHNFARAPCISLGMRAPKAFIYLDSFDIMLRRTSHLSRHEPLMSFNFCLSWFSRSRDLLIHKPCVCGLFVLSFVCLRFFLVLLSFRLGSKLYVTQPSPFVMIGSCLFGCFCLFCAAVCLLAVDERRKTRKEVEEIKQDGIGLGPCN